MPILNNQFPVSNIKVFATKHCEACNKYLSDLYNLRQDVKYPVGFLWICSKTNAQKIVHFVIKF